MLLTTEGVAPGLPAPALILTVPAHIALAAPAAPPPFEKFPKIARLSREAVLTEKLDGSNGLLQLDEDGRILVGSRTRWLTPGKTSDNFGFAGWVEENREELLQLGPGRHFGEWYGRGIQRGYGLEERRFALFNVGRWRSRHDDDPVGLEFVDPQAEYAPACCHVVPTLWRGVFSTAAVDVCLGNLRAAGSVAVPGFMKPEGLILFHTAASVNFKKLLEGDEAPKGSVH